ncbi:hypothetical protein HA520_16140 [Azotobacter chroococcum]|uniref:Uncharacterized protein n=1 Tax=Azotobacter chroococcum TaxID=353 RepID=A0AA44C980_9GAMM|nr:hypothetical protein [Azotobacter chroococcum]NHN78787.1 hypothetical protein [Azotobacter chroococcum]TBW06817.1 hypothetical protein E0E50_18750 [Azotobacter chroococcum subsp. isscasi]
MDEQNDLAALLADYRTPPLIRGATAELAMEVYRLYRLTNLADRLEATFGPTLLTREELLAWLAEQVERIGTAGIEDGDFASGLIDAAYLERLKIGSPRFFQRHLH